MALSSRRHAAVGACLVVGFASTPGRAHVEYVTEDGSGRNRPVGFLLETLSDPVALVLLGGVGLLTVLAAAGWFFLRPVPRDVAVFRETMREYTDLVPWLLRLSFGLPLVGAGFAGYLFSPAVTTVPPSLTAPVRVFQIGVGFLLLFGLATRVAAVASIVGYLTAFTYDSQLLLAFEYLPGLCAIALLGPGRPSADQVLRTVADAGGTTYGEIDPIQTISGAIEDALGPYEGYAVTTVRVGTGLTFCYLGLTQKLAQPEQAMAVVAKYNLTQLLDIAPELWVLGAGLAEFGLGLALLAGLFTRAAAAIGLFTFVLTLFGIPDDPVLAHISLFGLVSMLLITASGPLAADNWLQGRTRSVDSSLSGD